MRTLSGRFMDTINPLLSFSMDEIESMGHEVDDICAESGSSSSSEDESRTAPQKILRRKQSRNSISSPQHVGSLISEITNRKDSSGDSSGKISFSSHVSFIGQGKLDKNQCKILTLAYCNVQTMRTPR